MWEVLKPNLNGGSANPNACQHTLCAKPPDRNQEMGQDLRYTFLNSSWHTDAKKIPEKLIYRRHLACFFQNKISQKIFFG